MRQKLVFYILILIVLMVPVVTLITVKDDAENQPTSQNGLSYESDSLESLESSKIDEEVKFYFDTFKSSEIRFEELSYINDEMFDLISNINNDINYQGIFEKINVEEYDSLLEIYYNVISGRLNYFDYMNSNYIEKFDLIEPSECIYYLLDMDRDGNPEMVVSDEFRYKYIFKYDTTQNEVILVRTISSTSQLLGDNKVSYWNAGVGTTYSYYSLSTIGERKSEVRFYSAAYLNKETQQEDEVFMVGYPDGTSEIEHLKIVPLNEKVEAYFDELTETVYFKITNEQYDQLTKDYFKSIKVAGETVHEVMYSYSELFGNFID